MRRAILFATIVAGLTVLLSSVAPASAPVTDLEIDPPQVNAIDALQPVPEDPDSLRALARERGLLVGGAVEPWDLDDPGYRETVAREFSVVTIENSLKLGLVRPEADRYDFGPADEVVDFALRNGIEVRGHTLVWHVEVPKWVGYAELDRDGAIALLKQHVETMVGRYRGRIKYWDVLNEAINDEGTGLRDTIWLRTIGPEYVDMVFRWAHEADPDAILFYNDFNAEALGRKSDAVYALVKGMVERGVPINGVGLQGHYTLDSTDPVQSGTDLAANIERLGALGLQVQFTEVDVRIKKPVTQAALDAQAHAYWSLFDVCVSEPACTAFVTWGVTDKFSWVDDFMDDYTQPLLFDAQYRRKPAYWALRDVLENKPAATVARR
jgi:endo-1,4-beta-xylanase